MFKSLSDEARLWIYGFPEKLKQDELLLVRNHLDDFIDNWESHGKPVRGEYELLYDQFILIATEDDPSGCSIDSSVNMLKTLNDRHGLNALTAHLVFFRHEKGIRSLERTDFQRLLQQGFLDDNTIVFNTTLTRVGALRNGELEIPFNSSWQRKAFRKSA